MRTATWTDSVSVLDRVTAVLDAFGDDDALGVSEIARRANLPKSTVSRIVTDLVRQSYLDRDGSRLHLGLKLFELGQAVERPARLRRLAHPVMVQLRNMTGETVKLAVLDGMDVVLIASMGGRTDAGDNPHSGSRTRADSSALGWAMLAHATAEAQSDVLSSAPAALRGELAEVRQTGIAATPSDGATGIVVVASAILAGGSVPVGAIAVAGPPDAIDARRVGGVVRSAAATLSRAWDQRLTP